MNHVPVLLDEVCAAVAPGPGMVVVDATFGGGGYSRAFLEAGAEVIAFDRDPTAIAGGAALAEAFPGKLTLIEAPFDELADWLEREGRAPVDAVVFDFGVSSMHLDQAARGFSFLKDGPLDMRMGEGRSAREFVASATATELADVIFQYGEERRSRALARAIVATREDRPIETTAALAQIAEDTLGAAPGSHPATRMFQALRIFVNDELGQIVRALIAAERVLREGGRLVAVSFHSLEDRIVKRFLSVASGRGQGSGSRHLPVTAGEAGATFDTPQKAVAPSAGEIERNPRSRSSRLRAATRNGAPPKEWGKGDLKGLGLPGLVFSPLQQKWATS